MTLPPIEVRTYGDTGPLTAVLHGGPGAPGSVAGLARDLSTFARVLEPLQRRSGEVSLTVAQHVDDLAAVIPEPLALVGWSWGAMLGLSFAAAYPELVRSLALVGCGTYDRGARHVYRATMEERLGPVGQKRKAQLKQQLDQAEDPDPILAQIGALDTYAQAFDLIEEPEPAVVDAVGHAETWADVLRLQEEGIEPEAFASISCPVLMLHGDTDPHPGPSTFETLRGFVPSIEYQEFEQCGHVPWMERWAREPFLATLRSWVDT